LWPPGFLLLLYLPFDTDLLLPRLFGRPLAFHFQPLGAFLLLALLG
jgi:hypothetical protein